MLTRLNDIYNQETFFIDSCLPKYKYSANTFLKDLRLKIYFEKNNNVIIDGLKVDFCNENTRPFITLYNMDNEFIIPEIKIIKNTIIDDTWDKIEW